MRLNLPLPFATHLVTKLIPALTELNKIISKYLQAFLNFSNEFLPICFKCTRQLGPMRSRVSRSTKGKFINFCNENDVINKLNKLINKLNKLINKLNKLIYTKENTNVYAISSY